MSVVSEQIRRPVVSRRLSPTILSFAVPATLIAGLVGWFESVRLRMATPSLVDDWFGIAYSGPAMHALVRGDYGSAHVDFAGRYRPAYTALWNYVQWHLLADRSVAVAALWGAGRAALFLGAIWLLAVFVRQRPTASRSLLWLAPVAVALTPGIALDLVRYGPADPIMVAGLITGLALIGAGLRGFLIEAEKPLRKALLSVMIVSGYLVYLVGVYSKEASVCALAFAPFFVAWLGPTWRARIRRSILTRGLVALLAVLLVVPLVHVVAHLAIAASAGRDPYAGVHFSPARKVLAAVVFPVIGAPGPLRSILWLAIVPIALAVPAQLIKRHDPDRWLVIGVLCTGFLMSAFSLARGDDLPSRYYIPWIVAVSAVAVRGLAYAKPRHQSAIAILLVAVAFPGSWKAVEDWAQTEKSGSTAIEMTTRVVKAGCPIYLANFDVERRVAIPRLLGPEGSLPIPACRTASDRTYALSWQSARLPADFASRCRSGWQEVTARDRVSLSMCASFLPPTIPDQDEASGAPQVPVVRLARRARDHPEGLFQVASGSITDCGHRTLARALPSQHRSGLCPGTS